MNAEAYPGPNGVLVTSDETLLSWVPRLHALAAEGLVRESPPHHWQMTAAGASSIRLSRTMSGCERAMVPRLGPELALRTVWELFLALETEQWKCLPAPKRKSVKPLMLKDDIPLDERNVYFNRRKLDVSADYLRCLLAWKEIRDRGSF